MWHWWYNGTPTDETDPEFLEEFEGPETTVTWRHLLRESKDPGDQPDAQVATSRWLTAGRPTGPQY